MPMFGLLLAVQIFLIVDVVRNGRNQMWIMALVFLPVASTVAYAIVEILPRLQHNRHIRHAHAQIREKMDPEKDLREARDSLDVADTVANRTRVANALAALGRHAEALPLFRAATGAGRPDRYLGEQMARSLFLADEPAESLATLDKMVRPSTQSDVDRVALLRARIMEELGEDAGALAIYADVSTRLPGDEARCRYAAALIKAGQKSEAKTVLEEVAHRAKRLTRLQRTNDLAMYQWADRMLADLRS